MSVRYRLIHFEVISPDLWGHWQSKRIAQHHCVRLLHRITCERSQRQSASGYGHSICRCRSLSEKEQTFNVAIILGMVLGFLVERYFEAFGHFLPFLRRRMLEEGSQFDSELETDEWKTLWIICICYFKLPYDRNILIQVPELGHCVCVHRVVDIVIILIRWHDTWMAQKGSATLYFNERLHAYYTIILPHWPQISVQKRVLFHLRNRFVSSSCGRCL